MSNYDKHAARRLMAENPGMNYTAALRTVREKRDDLPWDVSRFLSASLAGASHLELVGRPGSGKSVLLRHLTAHRLSMGHDVFVIDIIKGGLDYHEDFLSAPAATSCAESLDLLERMVESRSGQSPALVVIEEVSSLIDSEAGDRISVLINMILRTGRSNGVSVALSSQRVTDRMRKGIRTEGLVGKVMVGMPHIDDNFRWINQDHASAIDTWPQKGVGFYDDGSGAEKFTFPHLLGQDVEAVLRAAGVPTREERDR